MNNPPIRLYGMGLVVALPTLRKRNATFAPTFAKTVEVVEKKGPPMPAGLDRIQESKRTS
jgi:hypothetical protein